MILKKKLFLNILRQLPLWTIIIGLIGIIEFYFLNKITILLICVFSIGFVFILLNKIKTLKTEISKLDNTLFNKENYFNHIYSILPQIILKIRTDGSWEEVNTNWVDLSGLNINDSLNFGWCKTIHPEDLDNLLSEIAIAEFRRVGFSKEVRIRTPDDSLKIINFSLFPTLNSMGEVDNFIGMIEDQSSNKRNKAMDTASQNIDLLLKEKKNDN